MMDWLAVDVAKEFVVLIKETDDAQTSKIRKAFQFWVAVLDWAGLGRLTCHRNRRLTLAYCEGISL
jgi:hypothetical protein